MATSLPVSETLAHKPEHRYETILGLLPFLVIGLANLLLSAPISIENMPVTQTLGMIFILGGYLVMLYSLLRGWLLGSRVGSILTWYTPSSFLFFLPMPRHPA